MTDNRDTPDVPEVISGPGAPDGPESPGGVGDLGGLLESAQQAFSAQAQAAQQVVEGSAGGGVVTVEMTGNGEVRSVTLAPEVVDPDDIDMLQDLIVAALHDAGHKVTELQRQALGALGGLDIGGLGEMFGGLGGGPGSAGENS
jgi:nucleoid-associated protein EbfC